MQKRIESFAADITGVLQQAVADAVATALKGAPATKGGRGAAPAAKPAKRTGLSAGELFAALRANGGRNIEGIAAGLGTTTAVVAPLLKALLAEGRVRRTGKARGTKYSAIAGKAPTESAAKAAAPSKKAAKKAAKKAPATKAAKKPAARKTAKKAPARRAPAKKAPAKAPATKAAKKVARKAVKKAPARKAVRKAPPRRRAVADDD